MMAEGWLEEDVLPCGKCGGDMKASKAIIPSVSGHPDFASDGEVVTVSPDGGAVLVDCLKCEFCGWSRMKLNDKQIDK